MVFYDIMRMLFFFLKFQLWDYDFIPFLTEFQTIPQFFLTQTCLSADKISAVPLTLKGQWVWIWVGLWDWVYHITQVPVDYHILLTSGKLTACELENGPVEIVDFPIKDCDFPVISHMALQK